MSLPRLTLSLLALGALAAASPSPPLLHYHEHVGEPEAARIRASELAARIVGGAPADLGAYPFLVGLVISLASGGTSVCGSSLLSSSRALTAAHCWFDGRQQARQFTLVLGSARLFSGGTRVVTRLVETHADYRPSTLSNDVAIISFDHVEYTAVIQPVALPSGPLLDSTLAGATVLAAGYGKTSDNSGISANQVQSHVALQVLPNLQCQQVYGSTVVTAATLCTSGARGASTCGGDSGGPLVLRQAQGLVLVGVTSFGAVRGCQAGYPAGFSRVSAFLSWIQARI